MSSLHLNLQLNLSYRTVSCTSAKFGFSLRIFFDDVPPPPLWSWKRFHNASGSIAPHVTVFCSSQHAPMAHKAVLVHPRQDRRCPHNCPETIIPLPFLPHPCTCPPRHPHLSTLVLQLLRLIHGPALTYLEDGKPRLTILIESMALNVLKHLRQQRIPVDATAIYSPCPNFHAE